MSYRNLQKDIGHSCLDWMDGVCVCVFRCQRYYIENSLSLVLSVSVQRYSKRTLFSGFSCSHGAIAKPINRLQIGPIHSDIMNNTSVPLRAVFISPLWRLIESFDLIRLCFTTQSESQRWNSWLAITVGSGFLIRSEIIFCLSSMRFGLFLFFLAGGNNTEMCFLSDESRCSASQEITARRTTDEVSVIVLCSRSARTIRLACEINYPCSMETVNRLLWLIQSESLQGSSHNALAFHKQSVFRSFAWGHGSAFAPLSQTRFLV